MTAAMEARAEFLALHPDLEKDGWAERELAIVMFEEDRVEIETSASAAYDGFGTMEIGKRIEEYPGHLRGTRVVSVLSENLEWQMARYQSGSHYAKMTKE